MVRADALLQEVVGLGPILKGVDAYTYTKLIVMSWNSMTKRLILNKLHSPMVGRKK